MFNFAFGARTIAAGVAAVARLFTAEQARSAAFGAQAVPRSRSRKVLHAALFCSLPLQRPSDSEPG